MVHVPAEGALDGMVLVRAGDRVDTAFGRGTVEAIWEDDDDEVVDVKLDGEETWMSVRPATGDLLIWVARPVPWPDDDVGLIEEG